MKALVTGATGFVGGAVARALVNSGIDVRVLARAGADLQNIQPILSAVSENSVLNWFGFPLRYQL